MFKDIVDAGGSGLLVPAVLFVLMLYGARALFSLHGRRGQHRKEFLELWDSNRLKDDLWLEVSIRHLFGTYLPAHVIRLALSRPDRAQSLLDLAELWPLFRFDADALAVSWRRTLGRTAKGMKVERLFWLTAYIALACVAVLSALVAARSEPASFSTWTFGFFTVAMAGVALHCLDKEESVRVAASSGSAWLGRINSAAPKPETTAK